MRNMGGFGAGGAGGGDMPGAGGFDMSDLGTCANVLYNDLFQACMKRTY